MIDNYNNFVKKTYEQAAPRIPNSSDYWVKKLGKRGKDVMIYTHDDLDGIFSAIAIKKYLKDKGFNIVGYGIVNYQEGWDVFKIDKQLINVAVDFADPHPDIDIYIDHHGEFMDGDKLSDEVRKKGAIKTDTGSAYEGIMIQLGLPVDSLVLDVIDMVDSAKYDEYGVKWTDLIDFDLKEIKKKPNSKLLFAGSFNQLLKRGDYQTIIEVIHNVDEPSIYKIFDYMRRLYPGNNVWLQRGTSIDDFKEEEIRKLRGKDFVEDAVWRMEQMKSRTRGKAEFKGIINSQQDFIDKFSKVVSYDFDSRSQYAGQSENIIEMDGYCIIGELAYVGSGTWANPIRARAIIQQDIESGRLPKEAEKVKWVLLQYGDTLQVCSYGKIEEYSNEELPKTKEGKPINDLKTFCIQLLMKFEDNLDFNNRHTKAGGHKGIGTISNIGIGKYTISSDDKKYDFVGLRYLDLFKNYIIASLSTISWNLNLSWENPFNKPYFEDPTPIDARTMKINQIRNINRQTMEVEYPNDFERKPSMKTMIENEARLKEMEKELEQQRIKEGILRAKAKHNFYRNERNKDDESFEEWEEKQKVSKEDEIQKETKTDDKVEEVTEKVKNNKINKNNDIKKQKYIKKEPKIKNNLLIESVSEIQQLFSKNKQISRGLTKVELKNGELKITHTGNMGNSIVKSVDPNLNNIGLPSISELKKSYSVLREMGHPEYLYILKLKIK